MLSYLSLLLTYTAIIGIACLTYHFLVSGVKKEQAFWQKLGTLDKLTLSFPVGLVTMLNTYIVYVAFIRILQSIEYKATPLLFTLLCFGLIPFSIFALTRKYIKKEKGYNFIADYVARSLIALVVLTVVYIVIYIVL